MKVSSKIKMKRCFLIVTTLFLLIQITGVSLTETPASAATNPLQKVQLKIEGICEKTLYRSIGSFFCALTPFCEYSPTTDCESKDNPLSLQRIKTALVSIPSVKTVKISVRKKWLFFKDYKEVYAVVEFELGKLTSETLILAVESASDQKNIYKVKFIE